MASYGVKLDFNGWSGIVGKIYFFLGGVVVIGMVLIG